MPRPSDSTQCGKCLYFQKGGVETIGRQAFDHGIAPTDHGHCKRESPPAVGRSDRQVACVHILDYCHQFKTA